MSDKRFYTVPFVWDKTLWVTTFVFFIFWFGFSAWNLWQIFAIEDTQTPLMVLVLLNVIMLPAVLICEGLAPQRLEIGEKKLVVLRRYNSVVIYADEVFSVTALPKNGLRGAIRTAGVGGLFGYFGSYYKSNLGSFKLYATNFDNLFLIRLVNGKKVVISCSEPEKMSHFKA